MANMFVDQIKIEAHAGKGGNGMVAFRREKYVPNGGPAGGDGGRGGSIILKVDPGLRTLMDFRYHRIFKAKNGQNGMSKQMTGAAASDLIVAVPEGTTVRDLDTGEIMGDLTQPGQELVIAKGGRGGRGNIHFASAKNPAPEIAENGEPGEDRYLELELKMLADVGLIGFPSVGKSTLLSVVTGAKPKIAAYEFTTLVPNLGMVMLPDGRDFAMADMPGLIEGASKGVGLGLTFLRHIERTRVLLHLIDMGSQDPEQAIERYHQINHELAAYDPELLKRPQIIVVTKMDLPDAQENLAHFKEKLTQDDTFEKMPPVVPISAITHQGVQGLMQMTADLLDQTPAFDSEHHDKLETVEYHAKEEEPAFTITRDDDGTWVLGGEKLTRLFKMSNLDHEDGQLRFARQLRHMGVDDALRAKGIQNGDLVRIEKFVFEFVQ
ncbi:GTPase ObgE [Limosilactobacillus mucosae]|uniref:GTPase Obg n=1 Tax=Limosilactobacillus mucosae TaxID=97478 RepID=A0AAJ1M9E7_LIMMU|nr:GTPase ObgE [Limosilactobacillus mucosae]MDC2828851.1 GTPase ObgE [Limosilactobacillus mucosae]MDC2838195.1 GTPase ObgE [Limosilactobacillus mucosae]MDC2850117.1 GTPase ObgE [Limosilactobacillus mucosae]MDC2852507.1 GTPase ObgE [Limosilactobacillus mucosae]